MVIISQNILILLSKFRGGIKKNALKKNYKCLEIFLNYSNQRWHNSFFKRDFSYIKKSRCRFPKWYHSENIMAFLESIVFQRRENKMPRRWNNSENRRKKFHDIFKNLLGQFQQKLVQSINLFSENCFRKGHTFLWSRQIEVHPTKDRNTEHTNVLR